MCIFFVYTNFAHTQSMATNKLNTKFCDAAQPGHHFDGDGLFLLVQKDGKKYWRSVTYVNGKRKQLGFGRYQRICPACPQRLTS
ncbi:Arm DNA-binding domain-containing protein [Oxalobacter vibrioformis]|uniref:Arm DNA-binding domain-containing protein n=1 Tax=Oxalobacter vibrioformis TaxID=933080 RepID=UPI0038CD8054